LKLMVGILGTADAVPENGPTTKPVVAPRRGARNRADTRFGYARNCVDQCALDGAGLGPVEDLPSPASSS